VLECDDNILALARGNYQLFPMPIAVLRSKLVYGEKSKIGENKAI
jgi:hypothetical protein